MWIAVPGAAREWMFEVQEPRSVETPSSEAFVMRTNWEAAVRKCREKRARGNYYETHYQAESAGYSIRRARKMAPIFPYKCRICDGWHLGCWRTVEDQRQNVRHSS